ncbi:hypothetical protein ACI77F_29215 [Pseudomonas tritici]|uniref:hypothetical protein n=1 Tax=Pseudomonas tritici TaxID=2745518 RepID=UPI00387B7788
MQLSHPDIDPTEAFQFVFREIKRHEDTGRKNFVVRVPVDMVEYLFSGIALKSGMSKVKLERLLTELGIYGFRDADGRILRRYLSGHSRMAWDTYHRLLFWSFAKGWISEWVFRDLLLGAYLREAAQLSARKILNRLKRQTSAPSLTQEQIVECFIEEYLAKKEERAQAAASRLRVDAEARELASSLGLEVIDCSE